MGALKRWLGAWLSPRRLHTRIAGISLALLLLVQAAGFGVIAASIERNARDALAAELQVGERIWMRLLEQKTGKLVDGARVLAADYGFRSALGSEVDDATLGSALENVGERIGASVTAWVDVRQRLRAWHGQGDTAGLHAALLPIAAELSGAPNRRPVYVLNGKPVQFVAVPVRAPVLLGWVVMGFPIDQSLIDDMRELSGLQVALLASATPTAALHVVATTLPASGHAELLAALAPRAAAARAASDAGATVGGEAMLLRSVPLGEGGTARVLLLRSVDEVVARYERLRVVLAAITLIGVLVFAAGSLFTARRITTPLRALVRASERLGRGDYTEQPAHSTRRDEVGDLAKAFDHMRVSLAGHEHEIRQLAYWDRLTGLPNRAQFRDAVSAAIEAAQATQPAQPVAVVMLDLDRFKHVNDVLGYAFGDRLLQAVASRLLMQAVRTAPDGDRPGTDVVARLSGDEFALLLPGSNVDQALAVADRVARAFEQPLTLDDQTVDLAAGFGVACWPEHAADADVLISRAEIAMYGAKRKTASALVYAPSLDVGSGDSLSLLSELRAALEKDELRLFLQPKIELATSRVIGAEALVRWQHPQRGLVPPMAFIPFAEQTGFVRQLTQWVFDETARQWPAMRALGVQRISVNLSTRDLLDQDLLKKLDARLLHHGAPASAFCLEITESAIMDEPQRALAMLNALSEAGFKLSIDDFGTGYSSLAYLKKLPVDELKIDKSFVIGMETDEDDAKIVRSTIDLAHNLGLSVVAEGVENAPIMERLRDLNCDEAQGYYMCKPLPAADLPAFVVRWQEKHAAVAA